MNQANTYYKHSGAMGPMGLVCMVLFGGVTAPVLGVVYGYAALYIPFIYFNVFMAAGFGAGVGLSIRFGAKLGRVRNSTVLLVFGFVLGLAAEYVGWVSWILALSEQEALVLFPLDLFSVMATVAEEGVWGLFGWTPTGVALYLVWGIEAVIIVGASTMFAWQALSSTPFCERCSKWIDEKRTISPLEPVGNPDELKSLLEQGDFEFLGTLEKLDTVPDAYTQVELLHCPTCQENHFLTLKSVSVTVGSDKKEKKEEKSIVENLIIATEQHQLFAERW